MKRGRLKMGFWFQTTFRCSGNLVLFQYDGEEWRRSFWRSLFIRRGRLKLSLRFQTTSCRISNLVPSPVWRGKVRMGVALWLEAKSNSCTHRATLSPTLSRRTGEGAGCTSRHKFLSDYRHSRAGGNLFLSNRNLKNNPNKPNPTDGFPPQPVLA